MLKKYGIFLNDVNYQYQIDYRIMIITGAG